MKRFVLLFVVAACGNDSTVEPGVDAAVDPDPLQITEQPAPGSLDDLHQRVIAKRCSGQPGLCHNGQFEPNLATPAMTYAYLVNRPALEKGDKLRVDPGDPNSSFLVDKLRNRGVATRMPLGAEPLAEADIKAIEDWISAGALRAPGAAPAPVLNNPPKRPEIALFNSSGTRIDGTGVVTIVPGQTYTFRHTVQDFETPDAMIPFAGIVLELGNNQAVALNPANTNDPAFQTTTYDANGPMGKGDKLDYRYTWTVPSSLPVFDRVTKQTTMMPASGKQMTVICVYVDAPTEGIAALEFMPSQLRIQ